MFASHGLRAIDIETLLSPCRDPKLVRSTDLVFMVATIVTEFCRTTGMG